MMDSDLDIARKATTRPVEEVAERLGLVRSDLILQGSSMAKISWDRLKQAGEGKAGEGSGNDKERARGGKENGGGQERVEKSTCL